MKSNIFLILTLVNFLILSNFKVSSQIISDIKFTGNETLTYEKCIEKYNEFSSSKFGHLKEFGSTDIGKPLHLFMLSSDDVNQDKLSDKKVTLLINNAIHPGEPCGVDASVMFVKTLLNDENLEDILSKVNIAIIPMYNIGGGLNRGCCSRANQNGPAFYGFRGNARNLDLNRDFIKCDSRNAESFTKIYQFLSPHLFLDTHTSNGADYQYVMTLITTQSDKATPPVRSYLNNVMVDQLYSKMEAIGYPMAPYVHTIGRTPDEGIKDYLETPRYSTGYSTLFNALGFVSETHMLKPYAERVQSTYELMIQLLNFSEERSSEIIEMKKRADTFSKALNTFEVSWELDTNRFEDFLFKGYKAKYKKSEFSENQRLYYDQDAPYEREIKYYNRYLADLRIEAPEYYIIPQAWSKVISLLKLNGVNMTPLNQDSLMEVEFYFINQYETSDNPYEGHYLHSEVKLSSEKVSHRFSQGDFLVPVDQVSNRYIVETLEPQGPDSFFAWNFFDSVLQQKEWFSTYVFEDVAAEMLSTNPKLKAEFVRKQKESVSFSENQWAQLYWLYKQSDNYEPSHNRYPIARYNLN